MDNLLKVSILNVHSSGLFIDDNSLFEKDITNFLLKDIFPNIHWNSNHLQHIPPRALSIFPILTHGCHNPFYQLTIHIPGNSRVCLKFF